jgi:hypothetical protein
MKIDWFGLCLEMMVEYLPLEVTTEKETKKYWEISEHRNSLLELAGVLQSPATDPQADFKNHFIKDFVKTFNSVVTTSVDGTNNPYNILLNDILLLSLLADSEDEENEQGGGNV